MAIENNTNNDDNERKRSIAKANFVWKSKDALRNVPSKRGTKALAVA